MTPEEARRLLAGARVGHLGTAGADGRPHLVPCTFALAHGGTAGEASRVDVIYNAVDRKPKRTTNLRRLANVTENPAVTLLVDHYDDTDWTQLWWVRADGTGRVLDPGTEEAGRAFALLVERYPQYRDAPPGGPVLAIDVQRWSGWAAAGGGPRTG